MPESAIQTLTDLVFHIRERWGGRPVLLSARRGDRRERLSTSDFLGATHSLALALEARGVGKGDRVAIFSENRPEWHIVDLACQLIGAITVPIYPTASAEQIGYILRNSGSQWVFYSDVPKRDLLLSLHRALTRPLRLVAFDDEAKAQRGLSLVPLQGEGAVELASSPLERFRKRTNPDDLASIIYTSGTMGEPKGVMLTHGNFVFNLLACDELFPLGPGDLALSFLPLSHAFERTVDYLFLYRGVSIHYAPSIERVAPLLMEVRPTVLTSVPRLYDRVYLRTRANVTKEPPRRQRIFQWAVRVGKRHTAARQKGFVGPWLAVKRAAAHHLVFKKVHDRFGGRLRFAISGGSPLFREIEDFFHAVGLRLYQGYGLTETAPVLTVNHPGAFRPGSVGRSAPGVEIRISADGEIVAKTPGLMKGYWENPEATAEVIDEHGWFHTGDIGRLDGDGFLFVTDRKKDLLVTSGGKNVAPLPIEQLLTSSGVISQAVVVGDNYPYVTALLVPAFEELGQELRGLTAKQIVEHPQTLERVTATVTEINERLADHERIRRWRLMEREFSVELGEITPTLKIRRRAILRRHAVLISSMYLKSQKIVRE